ncbi:MAG: hypothetical protein K0R59_1634 [Sphingobacterium sp.]|jgi:ferric-dicitrate binding protein FerR (iron transport regulator)|nr:hypothetical protein [Sphingobacterium sp.]
MKDNPMDWEKLLAYLNAKENNELKELSKEEVDMFLFADEVKVELSGEELSKKFSSEDGLADLIKRVKKRRLRRIIAYAAAVIAFVGIGLWAAVNTYQTEAIDETKISGQPKGITLQRSDGQEIVIGGGTKKVHELGGEINIGDSLISYTGNSSHDAGDSDIMNSVEVPRGLRTKIVLADGTQVWVNSETSIRYPVVFKDNKREVYLKGEAYFDVAHNANMPFIVHSGDVQVRVLGTAFGITTINGNIKTGLVRGSVELSGGKQKQRLSPGEVGQYNTRSGRLSLSEEDVRSIVAWKDNMLYFDNVNLDEITARLGRTYDCEFVFENPALKNLSFRMNINRTDDIQTILRFLKLSLPEVDFKVTGKTVNVMDKK